MKLPDFFLSSQIKRLIGLLLLNHNNCENDTLLIFNFTCMTALATILILYLQEIVRLHRVPIDLVLDCKLNFSNIAYHLQLDYQSERDRLYSL